ncbi:chromatin assembly factor 1 subunit A-domain-containing protein [Daldinia caldariorum]|uniref:chromatin assembly factor 1 subunit A-domain-containing protein n=1 Tax=Daldinia caldariorum TaxID=326644 RepID=UPI00200731D8|nr:chromatin assembly factor 1 subunit A-domain-containing protein [Daldinia caldariorum]KAI1469726.1 chromatin assembly factor 1 subunit A-domain-containing protein [Daldinia caldariorum]
MPLFSISPNIQESPKTPRKRTHEDFVETPSQLIIGEPSHLETSGKLASPEMSLPAINTPQLPTSMVKMNAATPGSSPAALTEAGSSPAMRNSPSPNKTPLSSPSKSSAMPTQPNQTDSLSVSTTQNDQGAKRKPPSTIEEKLNAAKRQKIGGSKAAEKLDKEEAKAAEKAKKEKEAEEKRQAKEAKAAEKAKKEAEAAEKRQKKEAEAAERAKKKAAEEAAKAAKLAEKEAARRKKEEAQGRQQNMLATFVQRSLNAPPKKTTEQATNLSAEPNDAASSPETKAKPEKSAYERAFQPFFVKPDVTLAPPPFEMDEETKNDKSGILDEYIRGERGEFNPKPFNPSETFKLAFTRKRGVIPPSVKSIMENVYNDAERTGARTESQTKELAENAQEQLNAITAKYLSFYEDVRPPYFGTVTTPIEANKLRSLARRPVGKFLPLNYDYDSEAEWVEDDGEDLDDEDDDDDSHDGDGEMEDFLDDSEDQPAVTRPSFLGEKEPICTGICFEDQTRVGPCATTYQYQLELLLDTPEQPSGIDPFSTSYWPAPAKRAITKSTVTSAPATSTSMPPPVVPTDAFSALGSGPASSLQAAESQNFVPKDVFDEFRRAIISDELKEFTKGTIIEMLTKKFPSCTKAQVKVTLDKVAHRISIPGAKKNVKQWALLPGFAL